MTLNVKNGPKSGMKYNRKRHKKNQKQLEISQLKSNCETKKWSNTIDFGVKYD